MNNDPKKQMQVDPDLQVVRTKLQEPKSKTRFSVFFLAAFGQLAIILAAYWFIAPSAMKAELAQPWLIVLWAIGFGLPLSLFEYLYHRYLLHSAVLPFLGAMKTAHGVHHGLTNVTAPVKAKEPNKLATVKSEFPILEEHQEESMMFPLWSGFVFAGVFSLLLGLPMELLFPGQPVFLSLFISVMAYYSAYEVWHAVLHLSFEEFWKPRFGSPVVRRIYGFHLMHHWRPSTNLAIVGFWGLALWDHLFRTYHQPERMPLHEAEVTYVDSTVKRPRWPISMFDRWQGGWARVSRRIERFLSTLFVGHHHVPK